MQAVWSLKRADKGQKTRQTGEKLVLGWDSKHFCREQWLKGRFVYSRSDEGIGEQECRWLWRWWREVGTYWGLVTGYRGKMTMTFSLNYFCFSYCLPFLLLPPPRRLYSCPDLFVCQLVCQQNCTKNYLTADVKAAITVFDHFSYLLVCFAVSTKLPPL